MILAGHAIKITNSEDFKNEFSSDLWQEILTNRKKNLDTTYYYHYSLAKKRNGLWSRMVDDRK